MAKNCQIIVISFYLNIVLLCAIIFSVTMACRKKAAREMLMKSTIEKYIKMRMTAMLDLGGNGENVNLSSSTLSFSHQGRSLFYKGVSNSHTHSLRLSHFRSLHFSKTLCP